MNTLYRIIRYFTLLLALSNSLFAQDKGKDTNNFQLNAHISSGVNYTIEYNTHVEGTYRLNSFPLLCGLELMYKGTYGIEVTTGYFPLVYYTNEARYQRNAVSVSASLVAYPVTTFLKIKVKDITFSAGGSLCILHSTIDETNRGTKALNNSFGFTGAIAYQLTQFSGFTITPRVVYYYIPEVETKTLSFQIRVLYTIFEF